MNCKTLNVNNSYTDRIEPRYQNKEWFNQRAKTAAVATLYTTSNLVSLGPENVTSNRCYISLCVNMPQQDEP